MAKQIFVSDEVYKILSKHKSKEDSFSKVILRAFHQGNVKNIIERVKKNPLSKQYSLDKKLLERGWKLWRKSIIR